MAFYQMHCSFLGPGRVGILQWPDDISIEEIEFLEETIALQLKTIKRCAKNNKDSTAPAPDAAPERK